MAEQQLSGKTYRQVQEAAREIFKIRNFGLVTGEVNQPSKIGAANWAYTIDVDGDPEDRFCPQCYKHYSDIGGTKVVPCWDCRNLKYAVSPPVGHDVAFCGQGYSTKRYVEGRMNTRDAVAYFEANRQDEHEKWHAKQIDSVGRLIDENLDEITIAEISIKIEHTEKGVRILRNHKKSLLKLRKQLYALQKDMRTKCVNSFLDPLRGTD